MGQALDKINKTTNIVRLSNDKQKKSWDPRKQSTNCAIFKKDELQLAKGDKLIATGNMYDLGIKNTAKLVVQNIDQDHIEFLTKDNAIKLKLNDLVNSHLQYDYVTTLNKSSKKQVEHILADIKAYSLDKTTLNELTNRAQESLVIFTNNELIAQKKLESLPIKLTAMQTVLSASEAIGHAVPRLINDKTLVEIKSDIVQAIAFLSKQEASIEQTEAKAVNFAIEKITSRNAGFSHQELVTEALMYALQEKIATENETVMRSNIENIIKQKHETGELVMGHHFRDGTVWTTKAILELERSIIKNIQQNQKTLPPLFDKQMATNILKETRVC